MVNKEVLQLCNDYIREEVQENEIKLIRRNLKELLNNDSLDKKLFELDLMVYRDAYGNLDYLNKYSFNKSYLIKLELYELFCNSLKIRDYSEFQNNINLFYDDIKDINLEARYNNDEMLLIDFDLIYSKYGVRLENI